MGVGVAQDPELRPGGRGGVTRGLKHRRARGPIGPIGRRSNFFGLITVEAGDNSGIKFGEV